MLVGLRQGEEGSRRYMDSAFCFLHLTGLDRSLHRRPGCRTKGWGGPSKERALQTSLLGLLGLLVSVRLLVALDGLRLLLASPLPPFSLPRLIRTL